MLLDHKKQQNPHRNFYCSLCHYPSVTFCCRCDQNDIGWSFCHLWVYTCYQFDDWAGRYNQGYDQICSFRYPPILGQKKRQTQHLSTLYIFETLQSMDNEVPEEINVQNYEYTHTTAKNEYKVLLSQTNLNLSVRLTEKYTLMEWKNSLKRDSIEEITRKTGHELSFEKYVEILNRALSQKDVDCYIDVLTSEDLENLKSRKTGMAANKKATSSGSLTKRYIILTYMTNQTKFHYPLSLTPNKLDPPIQDLKQIYSNLRMQLEAARVSALNDTQKSESFSINYNDRRSKNNPSLNPNKLKEIDQHKSQNQILKAKLARLEEQVQKKKVNIEIQAAIERTKLLKENIETANLELVDWKNSIQEQQELQIDLKKQIAHMHKKICSLLQTQKEVAARKKGDETEKQLNQIKNAMNKNTAELERQKKELEISKAKVKQLEIKAKKLNSEKEVIRKGRRGPYSSAGSVRSYNSYGSSKRSTGGYSNASSNNSAGKKSNYSYNSYSYGKR